MTAPLLQIDFHTMPEPVIRLAAFLDKHTRDAEPVPVQSVPPALRQPDVLSTASLQFVVRIIAHRFPDNLDLQQPTLRDSCWISYCRAGFPMDMREALKQDRETDDRRRGLFIRLTLQAVAGLPSYRLSNQVADRPGDLLKLAVAATLVHAVPKTLREAIDDGRLRDHREPGHAPNAPMLVSKAELMKLWPARE